MPASTCRGKGVCHNSCQANRFENAQKEASTEHDKSLQVIRSGLGPLPFVKDKDEKDAAEADEPEEAPARAAAPASNRPAVLPDGSYATQVSRIHISATVPHSCKKQLLLLISVLVLLGLAQRNGESTFLWS